MIVAIRTKKNENLLNYKRNIKKKIGAQIDHLNKSKYFIIQTICYFLCDKERIFDKIEVEKG